MSNITKLTDTGSYLVTDFYQNKEELESYLSELELNTLRVNGRTQQRQGLFMGRQTSDSVRWLRCPSIEEQTIYRLSAEVRSMITQMWESPQELAFDWNIVKIQKYDTGVVGMKSHADKILDLQQGVPIAIARFGAERTAVLKHKETKQEQLVPMSSNSLLIVSYEDNLRYTHGVMPQEQKAGASYSLVFRQSVTWLHECGIVWGERTPFQSSEEAKSCDTDSYWTAEQQRQALIVKYIQENKDPDFSLADYQDIQLNCIYP